MPDELPPPVRLDPIDPSRDAGFDALVRAIADEAMAARATRSAEQASVLARVALWSRPALAASVLLAAAASVVLALLPPPARVAPSGPLGPLGGRPPMSFVESAGVPAPIVELASRPRAVTATELVDALDSVTMARVR